MSYLLFKSLHLFGVVLLLGNIMVTAFWKLLADWTSEPKIVAFAQRMVNLTDIVFTLPGILLVLAGAYGMAWVGGFALWSDHWMIWGQSLFIASGLIWIAILAPTQLAQQKLSREFGAGSAIPDAYWRLNRRWIFWGVVATLLPLANLYIMVAKP
ncbi:MAG: DUF2269 domain-containing protein [Phyllobacteriaceae bacterium]|nr:DUF2269 domain-containing protein [Phyllobacteriaceae bacterium]